MRILKFLVFKYAFISLGTSIERIDRCSDTRWERIKTALVYEKHIFNLAEINLFADDILRNPELAFSCATGAMAVTTVLGDLYQDHGDALRALRFRQLASIFGAFDLQSRGQDGIDGSGWDVSWKGTIDRVMKSMYQRIQVDPNHERSMREILNNGPEEGTPSLKIGIVTICDYDANVTPLTELSKSNKERYATKHGVDLVFYDSAPVYRDYFSDTAEMAPKIPHAWRKIDALLASMAHARSDHDWLMWMDCDSFFMDDEVTLSAIVSKYSSADEFSNETMRKTSQRIALLSDWKPSAGTSLEGALSQFNKLASDLTEMESGYNAAQLIVSEDGLMLNTGVFMIRKSVAMFHFLWKVRALLFRNSAITVHPWWEQTAMVMLLIAPFVSDDSQWEKVKHNMGFPPFVRLYSQKQLNAYPPLIAGMLSTHAEYTSGDFIVSFSGCKTYTSQKVCNNLLWNYYKQSCTTPDCVYVIRT